MFSFNEQFGMKIVLFKKTFPYILESFFAGLERGGEIFINLVFSKLEEIQICIVVEFVITRFLICFQRDSIRNKIILKGEQLGWFFILII